MHTLFALEDIYGIKIGEIDGEVCLRLDKHRGTTYVSMFDMLNAWRQESAKLETGEITKEEYDQWATDIPNSIPRKNVQRFLLRNSAMLCAGDHYLQAIGFLAENKTNRFSALVIKPLSKGK